MTTTYPMLVAGELRVSGTTFESVNPSDESVIGCVPAASAADVETSVAAARVAQADWAKMSIFARAARLRALANGIRARGDEILRLEAADTGNTIGKLGADVEIAAAYLDYFAGLGTEMKGETVPATPGNLHLTTREPYGVVGRIVPFNHPFMFAAAHLAAPLMAGNAVVLKTPETSPLTGGILAELCAETLPAGLVSILSGFADPVGTTLVGHPEVLRIGFTGAVTTGLAIQRGAAAAGVKHVTLELGGKNPLIAFPDADPELVVDAAIAGMNFSWAGQSCGSTSRVLLHESLYDRVAEGIVGRVENLRLGDARDPQSEMGPVNNAAHHGRVLEAIDRARSDGATLLCGGGRPEGPGFDRGFWVAPTVFGDVDDSMDLANSEVFGPVLALGRWRDIDPVIEALNRNDLGLTAAVYTRDLNRALVTAKRLECGYVWINGVAQHHVGTPFGGWKNSGLGSEECLAELLSYTRTKAIHVMLPG